MNNIIYQTIENNLTELRPYLSQNRISAYRIINHTSNFLPLAVDIYQDNAVINVFSRIDSDLISALEDSLTQLIGVKGFFYKNRSREDFPLPISPPKTIVQEEGGYKFIVNLSDYLDTGLFLDHRETRKWIAEQSMEKIVLNTFAYAGSFTIYAARAGASKTHSVDISRVYCDWIKENLKLNGLSPEGNWVYKMDTLEFIRYAARKNLVFDIIIIDPPTFSNYKGKHFSVQLDHPALINGALRALTPSGFILFSTNYQSFQINRRNLDSCFIQEKMDTIPPDFKGTRPHRCYIISKEKALD